MIKCILPDNPALIPLLTEALSRKINTQWPEAQLTLRSHDNYWKYEHTQYVIYNLSSITQIYVHELIKIFLVKWEYSENMVHDVDTHKRYNLEEADWNKNLYAQ